MGSYRTNKLSIFWRDFCHYSNTASVITKQDLIIFGSGHIPVFVFIGVILSLLSNQGIGLGRHGAFMADNDDYQKKIFTSWENALSIAYPLDNEV